MRMSEDDICCQLKRICRIAEESPIKEDETVGILTTQSRDEWARCRHRLLLGTTLLLHPVTEYMIQYTFPGYTSFNRLSQTIKKAQ